MSDVASSWKRWENHYRILWRSSAKDVFWNMGEFVKRIAPLAIAENIHAWVPHSYGWLVLWKGQPIQEKRRVYVFSDQHGSRRGISWVKDGRIVMYTVKAMDSARWQRVVNWFGLSENRRLTTA